MINSLIVAYLQGQTHHGQTKEEVLRRRYPPSPDGETATQLKAYKQLESTIRCELHRGHCYIDHTSGHDNHRRLDHSEMTLWAKKIVSYTSTSACSKTKTYIIVHRHWVRQQFITRRIASTSTVARLKRLAIRHQHQKSMSPYRI